MVHHDPALWKDFSEKYNAELLDKNPGIAFLRRLENEEVITLVYAAKDEKHCHPLVLKKYLDDIQAEKANQNKPQP